MMPWLKVVIISGFGDFESAQKAISLGVDQYLLKPVRQADLTKVIEEMAARIEKSKAARGTALPAGMDENEVLKVLRQHFMRQLLYGETDTGKLLDSIQRLKLDILRTHYLTAVCSFDTPNINHQLLENTILETLDETDPIMYYFNNADRMTLLAYGNDPETVNERMYRFIGILRHELRDVCPVITTVISSDVRRLGEISDAYKTALGLLKTVSGVAAGQVINVSDTVQITANAIQMNTPFGPEFAQKIQKAAPGDAEKLLDELFSDAGEDSFDSSQQRYNGLIALMRICIRMTADVNPDVDEKDIAAQLSSRFDIVSASASKTDFRQTAEQLLRQALDARQGKQEVIRNHHVISQAEQYVREKFCDPNISLISVANHVCMSAAYFSTVFSQTTGRSFITYLTALRMERAKELLKSTNMKLADIAMEIGYSEPNYFSHVFRKTVGMTPKEYRNKAGLYV